MIHVNANRPRSISRYLILEVDGGLTEYTDTFQAMRMAVGHGHGETGLEDVPNFFPVAAYHYVPYENPAQKRMNLVANGIFWELSEPGPDVAEMDRAEPFVPADRIVKMRGTVAFCTCTAGGLSGSQVDAIRKAHARAVIHLQSMGWM
ncbi:hypothetical protein [Streptomyces sp. NPDC047939]|uniref:hypothetical protein n=1 Tax=Streptomyces sp. NPDC047939 TaxID=3155381 RepID=UPI003428A087